MSIFSPQQANQSSNLVEKRFHSLDDVPFVVYVSLTNDNEVTGFRLFFTAHQKGYITGSVTAEVNSQSIQSNALGINVFQSTLNGSASVNMNAVVIHIQVTGTPNMFAITLASTLWLLHHGGTNQFNTDTILTNNNGGTANIVYNPNDGFIFLNTLAGNWSTPPTTVTGNNSGNIIPVLSFSNDVEWVVSLEETLLHD